MILLIKEKQELSYTVTAFWFAKALKNDIDSLILRLFLSERNLIGSS